MKKLAVILMKVFQQLHSGGVSTFKSQSYFSLYGRDALIVIEQYNHRAD